MINMHLIYFESLSKVSLIVPKFITFAQSFNLRLVSLTYVFLLMEEKLGLDQLLDEKTTMQCLNYSEKFAPAVRP